MSKIGREERQIQNSNTKVIFAKGSFGKGPGVAGTIHMSEREIYYPAFTHSLTHREGPSPIGRGRERERDQQVSSSQGTYAPCFGPLVVMMRDASQRVLMSPWHSVTLILEKVVTGNECTYPSLSVLTGAKGGPPLNPVVCAQLSPDFLSVPPAPLLVTFSEESPDCLSSASPTPTVSISTGWV